MLINKGMKHVLTKLTEKGDLKFDRPNEFTDAAFGNNREDNHFDKM